MAAMDTDSPPLNVDDVIQSFQKWAKLVQKYPNEDQMVQMSKRLHDVNEKLIGGLEKELQRQKEENNRLEDRIHAAETGQGGDGTSRGIEKVTTKEIQYAYNNLLSKEHNDVQNKLHKMTNIAEILYRILEGAHDFCREVSETQLAALQLASLYPDENHQPPEKGKQSKTQSSSDITEQTKVFRMSMAPVGMPDVVKSFKTNKLPQMLTGFKLAESEKDAFQKAVHNYCDKCVELCWLCLTQNPPAVLVFQYQGNENMYETIGNAPTTKKCNPCLIFPPLLSDLKGRLLCKGKVMFVPVK